MAGAMRGDETLSGDPTMNISDKRQRGWWWAENEVFDTGIARHIGGSALLVYLALCRHADNSGRSFPFVKRLQAECGLSNWAIAKSLRTLESYGLAYRGEGLEPLRRSHPDQRHEDPPGRSRGLAGKTPALSYGKLKPMRRPGELPGFLFAHGPGSHGEGRQSHEKPRVVAPSPTTGLDSVMASWMAASNACCSSSGIA